MTQNSSIDPLAEPSLIAVVCFLRGVIVLLSHPAFCQVCRRTKCSMIFPKWACGVSRREDCTKSLKLIGMEYKRALSKK